MAYIQKQRGKYRARFNDPLGNTHSKTFRLKSDAERFLRELDAELVRGQWVNPRDGDMLLAQWAEEFLSLCRRLAPRTLETYRRDLNTYVLPRFCSYRLAHLPADEIENWLNDEIAGGIAPSSVHRHYRTLRRMLQVAVQKQKLLANPCVRVDPPRVPKRSMAFLDWDQVIRLAEAHGERFQAMIYFAVDTGMRWSEIIGLRRGSVDLTNRRIRVTEQYVHLEDNTWVRTEPKTAAGIRSITISAFTAALLRQHMNDFTRPGADSLVFTNGAGNPISASSFLTGFSKARNAASVSCRFHDLRHTAWRRQSPPVPIRKRFRREWATRRSQ